jgi:hypothetical protein
MAIRLSCFSRHFSFFVIAITLHSNNSLSTITEQMVRVFVSVLAWDAREKRQRASLLFAHSTAQ